MQESTIKNIGFNTSVFTGTGERESDGQGLARVLMAGAKAYEQKQEIDRVYDAREEAELAKNEKMVLNSKYLEHDTQRNEFISSGNRSSAELEEFERGRQQDMADTFSGFSSDWSKTSSHTHIGSYDTAIKKHFASDLKLKTSNMYDEIKKSASLNPDITMKELNTSIAFLNESSGITGDVYKTSGALISYTKSAIVDAEKTNPLEFNEEEWRTKHKLLSEVEDPVLRGYADDVAKTMESKKKAIISGENTGWKDGWYEEIIRTDDIKKLGMFEKEILADRNELITGTTKKTVLDSIRVLKGRLLKGSETSKDSVNSSMSIFKMMTNITDENTSGINNRNMSFLMNGADDMFVSVVNNIKTSFKDEPMKMKKKLLEISDSYIKSKEDSMVIGGHVSGDSIPSYYKDNQKKYIQRSNRIAFDNSMFGGKINYKTASKSMNTLGKIPDSMNQAIEDSVNSDNKEELFVNLFKLQRLAQDSKSKTIIEKDPKMSALISVMDSVESRDRILPLAKEFITDPSGSSDKIKLIKKDIVYNMRKDSSYDKMSGNAFDLIAEKLSYKAYFTESNGKDILAGENAKSVLESFTTSIDGIKITDPNSTYAEDDIAPFVNILSKYDTINKDEASIRVNRDSSIEIYQDGIMMARVDNGAELKKITDSEAYYNKPKNTVGNTAGRIGTGLWKSTKKLGSKLQNHVLGEDMIKIQPILDLYNPMPTGLK